MSVATLPVDRHGASRLEIVPALRLLSDFRPIETIVDGLPLPRGGIVSLTGSPGAGKTTLSTLLQVALVRGLPFAGRDVTCGSVLVLSGENTQDYTMHLKATVQDLSLCESDLNRPKPYGELLIIPRTFDTSVELDWIRECIVSVRAELVAVIVDTSAAFFRGDNENDNVAMHAHAAALRALTTLPGNPCVVVLCHPAGKGSSKEGLHPRGGSAFSGELDGNLSLWMDDATKVSTLHWVGKIRGPDFEPIRFQIASVELKGIQDGRGNAISSSVAKPLSSTNGAAIESIESDDRILLAAMARNPGATIRDLAAECQWIGSNGNLLSGRVDRRLKSLMKRGLVAKPIRGRWQLAEKDTSRA